MLRILLVTIFLVLGNVESLHTYKVETQTQFVVPIPIQGNSYIQTGSSELDDDTGATYPDDLGPTYITFLQDITPELGFQLAMEWRDDDMEVLQDREYHDFCSALENKTLQENPYYPNPIAMLGLSGQHCPIKRSSILFPWILIPRIIKAEFAVDCDSWINFLWYIEAKNSTKENPVEYLRAGEYAFTRCLQ